MFASNVNGINQCI